MRSIGIPELLVIGVVGFMVAFMIYVYGRVFSKAGYSPWLGLTLLIPLVNAGVIIWFAFSTWPIQLELDRLKNKPTPL